MQRIPRGFVPFVPLELRLISLSVKKGIWVYEMVDLSYNYPMKGFQGAFEISQLRKFDQLV